ncbi:acireductone dioxygenase [Acidocella sp. KAb 2-4]|uniref:1,2-dihydroxy-3-keto-5-methylthiopentene dioxygenase n=1 Tax=Acidocella sp. KAb 2-4 TaxID=2885158 RepID=UPI001D098D99|nr:cupin domain-containing protein [Acidocella sp. KAb 2-4]MCB5945066.1 acireductone dioxygenase [Acidocella sp. KAb 2-4]
MSRLIVYKDDAPGVALFDSQDPAAVATALKEIDVGFERWDSPVHLAADAPAEAILDAYRPYLDALMGATGAGSADVVKLAPEHPQAAALREKFLAEHTHSEPEIRFFVAGSGHFVLHAHGKVYDAFCEQGDLIHVPAGIKHWFDAGVRPDFTALRVFTDTSGWVAHFTGDDISSRFPTA